MGDKVLVVQHGEKERQPGDPGLTPVGRTQAQRTAQWLVERFSIGGVWCSPLRRAIETARPIAAASDARLITDARLRERMNWEDGAVQSLPEFLADWQRASTDRTYVPRLGDSSLDAAARFLEALDDIRGRGGSNTVLVVVAHGGVTVDALRTLMGDRRIEREHPTLIGDGVPCGAITTLVPVHGGWEVTGVASTTHLDTAVEHRPT